MMGVSRFNLNSTFFLLPLIDHSFKLLNPIQIPGRIVEFQAHIAKNRFPGTLNWLLFISNPNSKVNTRSYRSHSTQNPSSRHVSLDLFFMDNQISDSTPIRNLAQII